MLLKGRLNGRQRLRLGKLLDMLYKPSELAEEIGFAVDQVYRVYVPLGCPRERDSRKRLWIMVKRLRNGMKLPIRSKLYCLMRLFVSRARSL